MTKPQSPKPPRRSVAPDGASNGVAEPICEPTTEEVEAFFELLSHFGRTKLSLDSLMVRPIWHDALIVQLQEAGMDTVEGEGAEQNHWIHLFFRLGRLFQARENEDGPAQDINMRALAEHFGVPMSSATRIADQMVQRGLLERHSDPQDRRMVLLRLSSNGHKALDIINQATHLRMKLILQHFSPEERQLILQLGSRLFQMWNASLTQTPPSSSHTKAK